MTRTNLQAELIPDLAEASLTGDRARVELLLLKSIRALKSTDKHLSDRLAEILSRYSSGDASLRWSKVAPPPSDETEGMALLRVEKEPEATLPILPPKLADLVQRFVQERQAAKELLSAGVGPPCSLLLLGAPGTGKTTLARWMAKTLALPFVALDLATTVSSFLGKTGFNLKRSLDYARSTPCLMLLDEFDAIAKRRDDVTDVGELKRIVNVLLKELENWPLHSVLIAATNHPKLLDPAIERRFNVVMSIPLPSGGDRLAILKQTLDGFEGVKRPEFLQALMNVLEGVSGADIERIAQSSVRHHLVSKVSLENALIAEVLNRHSECIEGAGVGPLIREVHASLGENTTVREIASMFGKSVSTIQHHLKRGK